MQIYQDFWSTILSVRLPFTAMQAMQSMSSHTRGFCAFARFEFAKHRFIPAYAGLLTASTSSVSSSVWFIPAYAGLLTGRRSPRRQRTVHPRIRGAFDRVVVPVRRLTRFIPAYAGLLTAPPGDIMRWLVHPRIRGAFSAWARRHTAAHGSSPHTRGFFAPAARSQCPDPVHPRIRGAFAVATVPTHTVTRFIPAYAGLLSCSFLLVSIQGGSSPHTRGFFVVVLPHIRRPRFIPAYAGLFSHTALLP